MTNCAADAPRCLVGDSLSLPAGRQALFAPANLVNLVVHGMDQHGEVPFWPPIVLVEIRLLVVIGFLLYVVVERSAGVGHKDVVQRLRMAAVHLCRRRS